jgi:hypothetical protein
MGKAGQPAGPKTITGEIMRYLVAVHHPDDYDPSVAEDEAMHRDIDALNDEMKAAGVRIFVGGLHPARSMWAAFGCWRPPIWTRRWRGGERPPSPVGRRSGCDRFTGSLRGSGVRQPRVDGLENLEDLRRNWNRLIDVAGLTPEERWEALRLFNPKVEKVPGAGLVSHSAP